MISRKEVAARLREAGEDNNDWSMGVNAAFFKIDDIIGAQYKSYGFFFNRLAELIDPTCSLTLDEELSQELQGEMFRCNKCDAAFPRINGEYQYCPNCGARVVRDDRR